MSLRQLIQFYVILRIIPCEHLQRFYWWWITSHFNVPNSQALLIYHFIFLTVNKIQLNDNCVWYSQWTLRLWPSNLEALDNGDGSITDGRTIKQTKIVDETKYVLYTFLVFSPDRLVELVESKILNLIFCWWVAPPADQLYRANDRNHFEGRVFMSVSYLFIGLSSIPGIAGYPG